jgi:hypothetical protein
MRTVKDMRPLYIEKGGRLWASRGLKVFTSDDQGCTWHSVAACRGNFFQKASRLSRLIERFTRSGFQTLLPLSDTHFLATIRGSILKGDSTTGRIRKVFAVPRGSAPLNLCRVPGGAVYWGEYFFNEDRDAVHVYASKDEGESWEIAHTFTAGSVRHVHCIYYDEGRDGCWILTGDDDTECQILFADRGMNTVEPVFAGEQRFRSVSLVPCGELLLTGSDSPFERNHLQLLDPERGTCERVQEVEGSVFDVRCVGGFYIAAVTCEPSKVNTSPYASLWYSVNGRDWAEFHRARRDCWQMPYNFLLADHIAELPFFQHGRFLLPAGEGRVPIVYTQAEAIRGCDGNMLVWNLLQLVSDATM